MFDYTLKSNHLMQSDTSKAFDYNTKMFTPLCFSLSNHNNHNNIFTLNLLYFHLSRFKLDCSYDMNGVSKSNKRILKTSVVQSF